QGLTAGRTVDVEITGPEIQKLIELAVGNPNRKSPDGTPDVGIMGKLRVLLPGAQVFPQPSLDLSNPEIHIVPKLDQAADLQLTAADLGYAVDALVDGAYATDYFSGGDKIDLRIVGE